MKNPTESTPAASRARDAMRAAVLTLVALGLVTACSPSEPKVTVTVGPVPSSSASPSASSPGSPSVAPAPPKPAPSAPAPLGWPRAGWTLQTGLSVGLASIALYFPDSWTFDTNESGLWWDGTYHVFCDARVDHTLNNPGAPNAQTIATTQWNLMGYPPAASQHGFTTFYGYDGWGGNVTLMNGAVEPRAYVVVGDVWINCGAITRNTSATGLELWDVVDSIQIVDQSAMPAQPWNVAP
jgi:hypothetical protein